MSFLIQKPVLIAVRFMSITRSSVSVCINCVTCHSHFTLLSPMHPAVVLLCLSSMPVHPPCAAPVQAPLPVQPSRAFLLLSSFRIFSFLCIMFWTMSIYNILVFPLCQINLFVDFFFGVIIERWTLKAMRCQISALWAVFSSVSSLTTWKTYYCFLSSCIIRNAYLPILLCDFVVFLEVEVWLLICLVFFRQSCK